MIRCHNGNKNREIKNNDNDNGGKTKKFTKNKKKINKWKKRIK